ncbi:hypothetical protein ED407_02860 [Listeria monocytogenes]|uniref:hypothetical protein n=1 Tax=Listeria monocytogenes TaxID=1639 RepID=UPI00083D5DD1|nr:hypothetical protein [Listeria monocytogenes]EAD5308147.1 hypothetical protein [Listeria monocytogenes]EAD5322721.1 hypothetical protein [Listeria monocytogenes]EAD5935125.1 hypothetical protein [Listeria monocytogenes]EAE0718388.1 hypothetical protein [Listeria monocytogenes]EAE8567906.1 hypothetical protein [Listeria monocytogenes]
MYETINKFNMNFPALDFFVDLNLPKSIPAIIKGNKVRVNQTVPIRKLKTVLTEEVMHWQYTVGDITDLNKLENIKQEKFARRKTHEYLIPVEDFVTCHDLGLKTYYEVAEQLDIGEEFLHEAIEEYRDKYGLMYNTGKYIINFGSTIEVFREDKNFYPFDYGC